MRDCYGKFITGNKHTKEVIDKIKKSRSSQIIVHSEKTKDKIGKAHKGKKVSEKTKNKIRNYNIGNKYSKKVNTSKGSVAEKNPNWKGGRYSNSRGYILIRVSKNKYQLEHRYVMEQNINRKLKKSEIVHHINNDLSDNRIENLMLFRSQSEHIKYHASMQNHQKDELLCT